MNINWNSLIDTFLSGLVTALLIFIAGILWENHKTTQKKLGYTRLLFWEINDQFYWLKNYNEFNEKFLAEATNPVWNETKYFLASELPQRDFAILANHYRNQEALHRLFNRNVVIIKQQLITDATLAAAEAVKLLLTIAEIDQEAYTLQTKQLTQQNKK